MMLWKRKDAEVGAQEKGVDGGIKVGLRILGNFGGFAVTLSFGLLLSGSLSVRLLWNSICVSCSRAVLCVVLSCLPEANPLVSRLS